MENTEIDSKSSLVNYLLHILVSYILKLRSHLNVETSQKYNCATFLSFWGNRSYVSREMIAPSLITHRKLFNYFVTILRSSTCLEWPLAISLTKHLPTDYKPLLHPHPQSQSSPLSHYMALWVNQYPVATGDGNTRCLCRANNHRCNCYIFIAPVSGTLWNTKPRCASFIIRAINCRYLYTYSYFSEVKDFVLFLPFEMLRWKYFEIWQ